MTGVIILACLAPMAIWLAWRRSFRVVYQGEATVLPRTTYVGPSGNAFVEVFIPRAGHITADISIARAQSMPHEWAITVQVVVKQAFLGLPWVDSITWPGEGRAEKLVKPGDGMYVAIFYLFAGIAALGLRQPALSALAFVVSGFLMGFILHAGDKPLAPKTRTVLTVLAVLLGIGSFVLFLQVNLLTLLLGVIVAFSFGQLTGMLVVSRRRS